MSVGDAQRYEIQMDNFPSFKMYHYATGGSVDKTIWSDAGKTTPLAQPAVANANGSLTFFADGFYRLVFKDSDDVSIPNMDYDNFMITADFATTFEQNQGTVLPSASASNKGHEFLLFDGSSNILGVYRSDGTQYKAMNEFTAAGDQVFDSVVTKDMPVYNVLHPDWGAKGDDLTDDAASIQAAANAIPTEGGVLYFPQGIYKTTSKITITNKNIRITGDGLGISIVKCTAATGCFDYDTITATHVLIVDDISIQTDFAGAGDAINALWPASTSSSSNLIIRDIEIKPTDNAAFFTRGVVLTEAVNAQIDNSVILGKTADIVSMTDCIAVLGASAKLNISGCDLWSATNAINIAGTSQASKILGNSIEYVDNGIVYAFASAIGRHIASENNILAFTSGVSATYVNDSTIANNIIGKYPTSTEDFIGINVASTSSELQVLGNSARGAGSSGTDISIKVEGANCVISNNCLADHETSISSTSNGHTICSNKISSTVTGMLLTGDNHSVSSNNINATTTGISVDGGNSLIEGNYIKDAATGILADTNSTLNYFDGNFSDNTATKYADTGTGNRWGKNFLDSSVIQVASAATLTLPNIGEMFEITGSTQINNITASWEGRLVTLYKRVGTAGTATIKDSITNIRLVADVALAAESVLTLRASSDGNWYQVATSIN